MNHHITTGDIACQLVERRCAGWGETFLDDDRPAACGQVLLQRIAVGVEFRADGREKDLNSGHGSDKCGTDARAGPAERGGPIRAGLARLALRQSTRATMSAHSL